MRWRDSSRGRLTLFVAGLAAVPVLGLGLAAPGALRHHYLEAAGTEAEQALNKDHCSAELLRKHKLEVSSDGRGSYYPACTTVWFILRAEDGQVIKVSPGPEELLTIWPFGKRPNSDLLQVHPARGSRPMPPGGHLFLVRAQERLDLALLGLVAGMLVFLGLVGWLTWTVVGRVLRPVGVIRAELADITANDLSRRVTEPPRRDELHELVTTVNATLARLDKTVTAQRRFVADGAHELRSPIAALRGELELALAHPDRTDWPEAVRLALTDTIRLQDLAADLLLLAQLDDPGMYTGEEVDLVDLIGEHLDHRTSPAHLEVTGLWPTKAVVVSGWSASLNRLLDNLLDNAERHAARFVEVRLSTEGEHAIMEVVDDGPGIPLMDRGRIFEPFARLDDARAREHGGTGLGLAIARQIAENHGGRIWAGQGPGARFRVQLPLSRQH